MMKTMSTTAAMREPLAGALEWIDRYANAVAEQLPVKQRSDIQMEVRSLLLDEIDAAAGNGAPTEDQVLELLRRYPSPTEMAARYGAPQYLIGPRYYHNYVSVLTLVTTIVLIVNVVAIVAAAFVQSDTFSILSLIGNLFSGIFVSAGIVTLIFALLERSGVKMDDKEHADKGWSPRDLPAANDRNRANVGDMVWDIVWTLILLTWLNVYVNADGSMPAYIGEWVNIPLFSALFVAAIPWLSLLWTGELMVTIFALARRRWRTTARVLVITLNVIAVGVMTWVLNAGAVAGAPTFEPWVRGFMVVAILVSLFEIAGHLWAIFKTETNRPGRIALATIQG